jgi:hypothetical protein
MQTVQSNVQQSMAMRNTNGLTSNVVRQIVLNAPNNFNAVIPQLKALQAATGKPIYIAGVISSVQVNGVRRGLPPATHYFNRLHFCKVQKQLLAHGVWAINPACLYQFAMAIKANPFGYNLKTAPAMFNAQNTTPQKATTAIKRLQLKNKMHCSFGCCAVVICHWPFSLLSNGTLMELSYAIKHGLPIYCTY